MGQQDRILYFYIKEQFPYYKDYHKSNDIEIISITQLLGVNSEDMERKINEVNQGGVILDITAFGNGYYKNLQTIGENLFKTISPDVICVSDSVHKEYFSHEFRYIFSKFSDIENADINITDIEQVEEVNTSKTKAIKRHRKIVDLGADELKTFFHAFRESLYGHEKFKDQFETLIADFLVFNRIGEHKILSIFLMGESGVGKTEVARTICNCLGGGKLAKVNFGNYSGESSLNSLIGSSRGFIGSEDGEIFIRVRETNVGVILIDEFEKSNATLFNYFLDVLESGKMINSQAEEIDLNGFIIVFTSNISKDDFPQRISPELRSRFDYKGLFTKLYNDDKRQFVQYRLKSILNKYNTEFSTTISPVAITKLSNMIDVDKYTNMRDLNKKIKRLFVSYISNTLEPLSNASK